MKKAKSNYEELYYDLLYKNKKLLQENKELKEEIEILKRYSKNGDLKEIIIQEIKRYRSD